MHFAVKRLNEVQLSGTSCADTDEERTSFFVFAFTKRNSTRIWACCSRRVANVLETVSIDLLKLTAARA